MGTPRQIRAGLAANLARIDLGAVGLTVYEYPKAVPVPPAVQVLGPAQVQYDQAMHRGLDSWEWTVQAFVGLFEEEATVRLLDQMLEPTGAASVKTAIEYDPTLGGAVSDLWVRESNGMVQYTLAGTQGDVLGSMFTVVILN